MPPGISVPASAALTNAEWQAKLGNEAAAAQQALTGAEAQGLRPWQAPGAQPPSATGLVGMPPPEDPRVTLLKEQARRQDLARKAQGPAWEARAYLISTTATSDRVAKALAAEAASLSPADRAEFANTVRAIAFGGMTQQPNEERIAELQAILDRISGPIPAPAPGALGAATPPAALPIPTAMPAETVPPTAVPGSPQEKAEAAGAGMPPALISASGSLVDRLKQDPRFGNWMEQTIRDGITTNATEAQIVASIVGPIRQTTTYRFLTQPGTNTVAYPTPMGGGGTTTVKRGPFTTDADIVKALTAHVRQRVTTQRSARSQ